MPGNDAFTKVLLHLDQSAGSSFTDTPFGATPHTFTSTTTSSVSISSAAFEFGTGSLLSTGGGGLTTPTNADLYVSSGDFTVDLWARRAATSTDGSAGVLFGQSNAALGGGFGIIGQIQSSRARFAVSSNGTTFSASIVGAVSITSVWTHLAFVRTGSTLMLFVNGVSDGTATFSGTVFNTSNSFGVATAGESAGFGFNGNTDEFRFSVGVARWTANFTPFQQVYDTYSGFKLTEHSDHAPIYGRKNEVVSY